MNVQLTKSSEADRLSGNHGNDIFQRDKSGELIRVTDPEFPLMKAAIRRATEITSRLNSSFHEEAEIRDIFSELINSDVDDFFQIIPPFYTDFGQNITIGKGVFINHACTFMDRGGITIEDDVKIGPKVNLITTNHPIDPSDRRATLSTPIQIKRNAWIGAGATVLPGITIGENSVVGAGSVVTRDVPPNVMVAGVPAKIVKYLA
jgi:acetyltransferase-like isoleucine patch superfamily enzyme